jgi:hypothetical protein
MLMIDRVVNGYIVQDNSDEEDPKKLVVFQMVPSPEDALLAAIQYIVRALDDGIVDSKQIKVTRVAPKRGRKNGSR